MLRAAAKNHRSRAAALRSVALRRFPARVRRGEISDEFRLRCAVDVFRKTQQYDATIADSCRQPATGTGDLTLISTKFQDLRYGENPQQIGRVLRPVRREAVRADSGEGALVQQPARPRLPRCASRTRSTIRPRAIIKHTNPCGVARRAVLADALRAAIESDPVSAFGGIIGVNRDFDGDCARIVAECSSK